MDAWSYVDRHILPEVRAPRFPDRDFVITDFGAVGDGVTPATDAVREAIAACHAAGGGRVVVPAGTFLTGAVHLRDDVNLHVAEGATLLFSTDPDDYLPLVLTRYEGLEVLNYSPMIYARSCRNVAITGAGTLDGQGGWDGWWDWFHRCDDDFARLRRMAAEGTPVSQRAFGPGSVLRSSFVQPFDCSGVLVEGVTIVRSPFWVVHPVLCRNVTIRDVRVDSEGPNNDGIDLESCRSVVVRGCHLRAGDDSIAIKSGREEDGLRIGVPSEDILIEDCTITTKYGAITIGSDMTGGARNIYVRDCEIGSPTLYFGLYIKTNSVRGGFAEDVYLKDLTISNLTKDVVSCDFYRGEGDTGPLTPRVRRIELRDVRVGHVRDVLSMTGYPRSPIEDVRLVDCSFESVDRPSTVKDVDLALHGVRVNGRPVEDPAGLVG